MKRITTDEKKLKIVSELANSGKISFEDAFLLLQEDVDKEYVYWPQYPITSPTWPQVPSQNPPWVVTCDTNLGNPQNLTTSVVDSECAKRNSAGVTYTNN